MDFLALMLKHPVTNDSQNIGRSQVASRMTSFHDQLRQLPFFAIRMGVSKVREWKVPWPKLKRALRDRDGKLESTDLVPNIEQKGVDLRIGLDIAKISVQGLAQTILVVSNDTDLIPALKFARREGVRIFISPIHHKPARELVEHADRVVRPPWFDIMERRRSQRPT
jgi:uncharacterized LabA/DUF88 family protein